MITVIDPSSFTLYEQHSDAMASQFMADYAREGGADAYTKARGEAMAATRSATKSAQAGTAAQMAAMGLNPSSGRYQSAMQDIAMKGALGEVGATQNAQAQQDARRYTAAQAAQQGTLNAAKLKGDIWSLQNQQSDVVNRYGVGMAGAAASMANANANMKNVDNNFTLGQEKNALDKDQLGLNRELGLGNLGISQQNADAGTLDAIGKFNLSQHTINDPKHVQPSNPGASAATLVAANGIGKQNWSNWTFGTPEPPPRLAKHAD